MSEAIELTIMGQCSEIVEKPNGWTEFKIVIPGEKYPKKLATKLPQLIEQARGVKDAMATWTFKESESDRVGQSGKPYINRYLEGVELGGDVALNGPQAHHEALHYADKDRSITRMACLRTAAQLYAGSGWSGDDDPPLAVMDAAARFEMWIYRDMDDIPF